MTPPLASFVDRFDLTGKTVIPFHHTHGGSGVGEFKKDIVTMCSNSTITKGFGAYDSGDSETIALIRSWLSSAGL